MKFGVVSSRAIIRRMKIHLACSPPSSQLVVAPGAATAPRRPAGLDVTKLDALVAAEFAKDGVGGATVGVVKGGALVWAKGYGLADIEARTPASEKTIYRIGSITKPFTAVMLLQLVETRHGAADRSGREVFAGDRPHHRSTGWRPARDAGASRHDDVGNRSRARRPEEVPGRPGGTLGRRDDRGPRRVPSTTNSLARDSSTPTSDMPRSVAPSVGRRSVRTWTTCAKR